MKIEYGLDETIKYYDMNGEEIHEGDVVILDGKKEIVYLTEGGYLGVDATNPIWIENGRACPCEFGIYPFGEYDEPLLFKEED